jgi:purine-binding chemotaxis protein CheW
MQTNVYQGQKKSIIIFEVSNEEFAIDLLDVQEIIRAGHVRRLPQSLDFIDGIYNDRGDIIHIINLRKKLNLDKYQVYKSKSELYESVEGDQDPESEQSESRQNNSGNKYIIIVNVEENKIGFYADKIHKVSQVGVEDMVDLTPVFQTNVSVDYIKGVIKFEDRPRILINLSKILSEAEKLMIQKELDSLNENKLNKKS